MDAPSLRDEVARKALETIEKMVSDLSLGKINKQQYKYGIEVLWSALSGLADKEFFTMMELMGEEVKKTKSETYIIMRNEAKGVLILRNTHDGILTLMLAGAGKMLKNVYDHSDSRNPAEEIKHKIRTIVHKFANEGFSLI